MNILRLHLKAKWWNQIKDGSKYCEYRIATPYWQKRLEGKDYDIAELYLGYPKKGDESRVLRKRISYIRKRGLLHEEFGPKPVKVYAIRLLDI